MREYELVLVLRSTLSEAERKKLIETMKSWAKDVKFTLEKEWGSKALAYKIKRDLMGFYYDFVFETKDVIPADFEKRIVNNDNVLRHLVIRKK